MFTDDLDCNRRQFGADRRKHHFGGGALLRRPGDPGKFIQGGFEPLLVASKEHA